MSLFFSYLHSCAVQFVVMLLLKMQINEIIANGYSFDRKNHQNSDEILLNLCGHMHFKPFLCNPLIKIESKHFQHEKKVSNLH